jgi:magnesium transporter
MSPSVSSQAGELVALVREGHLNAFIDRAWAIPAADLADAFALLPLAERERLVAVLPPRLAAHGLVELAASSRAEITLGALDPQHAARLISELEDDDAADLLGRLPPAKRRAILACVGNAVALDRLLVYEPKSAGGLMTARMVTVTDAEPVGLAIEAVRRQAAATGDVTEIFVTDSERRFRGLLSIKQLLLASPTHPVRDVMTPHSIHVGPAEDQQVIARVIARYNLSSVPVVDRGGRLLGRVTADDVRDVAVDEAADDLLRFGGVSVHEPLDATWVASVRTRLPSLYTNLLAAFGAATVVYLFRGSVLRIVTLAVWMPVVAGVGGNAATQALATSVRRLVIGDIRGVGLRRIVAREALTGAANGLAIGIVIAMLAVLLGESWKLGLVVMLAMVINLLLAGAVGAAIPVLLKRTGRDPALASPLLVTSITDAIGFALLLGLASALLL